MTTSNGQIADVVEGLVESTNECGVRVAGEWRKVSKFHPVDLPDRGARVRLELDNKAQSRHSRQEVQSRRSESLQLTRRAEGSRAAAYGSAIRHLYNNAHVAG